MAEEGGFGGIAIRGRDVEGLGRVDERLGLLHKAGEVEHCSWYLLRGWQLKQLGEVLLSRDSAAQNVIPPRRQASPNRYSLKTPYLIQG